MNSTLENILSEIIGILATILIVDFMLKQKENQRIKKIKTSIIGQLKLPLTEYLTLLYEINDNFDSKFCLSLTSDFLRQEFLDKLKKFDFSKRVFFLNITWGDYFFKRLGKYKDNLEKLLNKNSMYLEPEVISVLTNIIDSPLEELKNFKDIKGILDSESVMSIVKSDIKNFVEIVDFYNRESFENISIDSVKENYNIKKILFRQ